MSQRKIGIFGGSFDPVHTAHIALAKAALERFGLDEVRLMPCKQQALKQDKPASAADRCAMLRLALGNEAGLTLDCRELYRTQPIYTYETIRELQAEMPEAEFWFILGMDSVCSFHRWYRAQDLVELCRFIAFDRPGFEPPKTPFDPRLLEHRLTDVQMDVSSSSLRAALAKNASIGYSILPLPLVYLRNQKLYNNKG